MLDVGHLPTGVQPNIQIFNQPCTTDGNQFTTWNKPRGISMLEILCIGGGGGGGGGLTGAASTSRGGGGGGGSSGISRVLIPALLLPDRLYLQVGAGGVGSGSGVGGTSGVLSYVLIYPGVATSNFIIASGAAVSVGGGAGTASVGGAGGAGGTLASIGSMPLSGLGNFNFIAGQAGAAGGFDANGGAITIPVTSTLCQGGSGGGGHISVDQAGGACTAIASSYLSEQRWATTGTGTTANGSGGTQVWKPFFNFGGSGGGGSNAAAGANGGPGAYGSGGGGGGGGTTGGRGGNGGNGIIIITAW